MLTRRTFLKFAGATAALPVLARFPLPSLVQAPPIIQALPGIEFIGPQFFDLDNRVGYGAKWTMPSGVEVFHAYAMDCEKPHQFTEEMKIEATNALLEWGTPENLARVEKRGLERKSA